MSNYKTVESWQRVFAKNLQAKREEMGLTQEKLAELLEFKSGQTISNWETSRSKITVDDMIKVARFFKCDLDHLVIGMEEPTHKIKFIREETGLTVDAIRKLTSLKDTGLDELISDIITHENAPRLLRVLHLASNEDEIAWMSLDELPRGLLSSYADKPIDFTSGIGCDVAEFLASNELVSIVKDIRKKNDDKQIFRKRDVLCQYNVFESRFERQKLKEQIEEDLSTLYIIRSREEDSLSDKDIERIEKYVSDIQSFRNKLDIVSYAEWRQKDIVQEYADLRKEMKELDQW